MCAHVCEIMIDQIPPVVHWRESNDINALLFCGTESFIFYSLQLSLFVTEAVAAAWLFFLSYLSVNGLIHLSIFSVLSSALQDKTCASAWYMRLLLMCCFGFQGARTFREALKKNTFRLKAGTYCFSKEAVSHLIWSGCDWTGVVRLSAWAFFLGSMHWNKTKWMKQHFLVPK